MMENKLQMFFDKGYHDAIDKGLPVKIQRFVEDSIALYETLLNGDKYPILNTSSKEDLVKFLNLPHMQQMIVTKLKTKRDYINCNRIASIPSFKTDPELFIGQNDIELKLCWENGSSKLTANNILADIVQYLDGSNSFVDDYGTLGSDNPFVTVPLLSSSYASFEPRIKAEQITSPSTVEINTHLDLNEMYNFMMRSILDDVITGPKHEFHRGIMTGSEEYNGNFTKLARHMLQDILIYLKDPEVVSTIYNKHFDQEHPSIIGKILKGQVFSCISNVYSTHSNGFVFGMVEHFKARVNNITVTFDYDNQLSRVPLNSSAHTMHYGLGGFDNIMRYMISDMYTGKLSPHMYIQGTRAEVERGRGHGGGMITHNTKLMRDNATSSSLYQAALSNVAYFMMMMETYTYSICNYGEELRGFLDLDDVYIDDKMLDVYNSRAQDTKVAFDKVVADITEMYTAVYIFQYIKNVQAQGTTFNAQEVEYMQNLIQFAYNRLNKSNDSIGDYIEDSQSDRTTYRSNASSHDRLCMDKVVSNSIIYSTIDILTNIGRKRYQNKEELSEYRMHGLESTEDGPMTLADITTENVDIIATIVENNKAFINPANVMKNAKMLKYDVETCTTEDVDVIVSKMVTLEYYCNTTGNVENRDAIRTILDSIDIPK